MVNQGATGAILVTSGEFTKSAIEAATKQGHVQLVDGDDLRAMLGPLPEPGLSRWFAPMFAELGQGAALVGRYAGGRLLDAAEERIRGRRRSGVAWHTSLKIEVMKTAVGLLVMFLGLLAAAYLYNRAFTGLKNPGQATTAAQRLQVPHASQPAGQGETETFSESPLYREQTPEEIRESQRKADEAMKVLEASTPEI